MTFSACLLHDRARDQLRGTMSCLCPVFASPNMSNMKAGGKQIKTTCSMFLSSFRHVNNFFIDIFFVFLCVGKAEETIHTMLFCYLIAFETSCTCFFVFFLRRPLFLPFFTGALNPQHWNSGRSECKLCQALVGWELPVFWSFGRLGATVVVPRYWRASFGSPFYRWSQIQALTYTVWQWFEGNSSLLKVFRSWSWRITYCCTDPQHIAYNVSSFLTVRGLSQVWQSCLWRCLNPTITGLCWWDNDIPE